MNDKHPSRSSAADTRERIKALYATMTVAEQDSLRNEFFGWQPRCPRCGTPKYLGSAGCPGPGREHAPRPPWPEELLNARVTFWCCPEHVGAPHRVEWRAGVAFCLTDGCGKTSAPVANEVTE